MKRAITMTAACLAVLAGGWMSAETQPDEAVVPDMEMVMKMMEEAAKPNDPHHAYLKKMEGDWKITAKFTMEPGSPPEVSHGTSKNRLVLGGRQIMSEVDLAMKFMGQEMDFDGIGIMGYDKTTKRFQSTWVDTMSTSQLHQVGGMKGDSIVIEGTAQNFMGEYWLKIVYSFVDDGYDMEFWEKGENLSPEYMNTGVIEYRR
jgi:hypothetical protein